MLKQNNKEVLECYLNQDAIKQDVLELHRTSDLPGDPLYGYCTGHSIPPQKFNIAPEK